MEYSVWHSPKTSSYLRWHSGPCPRALTPYKPCNAMPEPVWGQSLLILPSSIFVCCLCRLSLCIPLENVLTIRCEKAKSVCHSENKSIPSLDALCRAISENLACGLKCSVYIHTWGSIALCAIKGRLFLSRVTIMRSDSPTACLFHQYAVQRMAHEVLFNIYLRTNQISVY